MKTRKVDPPGDRRIDRVLIDHHWPPGVEDEAAVASAGSNHWMLVEDVHLGVVPYGHSDGQEYSVSIVSKFPRRARRLVVEGLASSTWERELEKPVHDWVRSCAAGLAGRGAFTVELAYWLDDTQKPVGFRLLPVDERALVRKQGRVFQRIPEGALARRMRVDGLRREMAECVRPIPHDRVVSCTLPEELESHCQDLGALSHVDRQQFPRLAMSLADGSQRLPGFDYERVRFHEFCALAEATQTSGWNGRGTFREVQTAYHEMFRFLRFERFKVVLREHSLSFLNRVVGLAGRKLGFSARIVMQGLPSLEDVDRAEQELRGGATTFDSIIRRFF